MRRDWTAWKRAFARFSSGRANLAAGTVDSVIVKPRDAGTAVELADRAEESAGGLCVIPQSGLLQAWKRSVAERTVTGIFQRPRNSGAPIRGAPVGALTNVPGAGHSSRYRAE
jgi:hypothetical protein